MMCPHCHKVIVPKGARYFGAVLKILGIIVVIVGGNTMYPGLGWFVVGLLLFFNSSFPVLHCICD
jgi:hypothetical protein